MTWGSAVWHSRLMDDVYLGRLDALEQIWQVWAQLGDELTEEQWSAATRCPGWDVAALYAHYSVFPFMMNAALPDGPVGEPVTAVEVIRQFNAPDGLAHTMAETVADGAVSEAAAHTRKELVERFSVHGPRALQRLRQAEATMVVPWPTSGAFGAFGVFVTLVEALRIVLMEATVHLLDVQRALGRPPIVPKPALRDTVALLAELAPAVDLIEAATGRSTHSPLPVLR
ncbi:MAG: maleylpyruvate isomerase N-terminal domain-containing protein [Pseudonocardiaceae bacterium]